MWEYRVEQVTMADRWSKKKQEAEVAALQDRLNTVGAEGWEMISYESVPMYGSFSNNLNGYAYFLFFKRQS